FPGRRNNLQEGVYQDWLRQRERLNGLDRELDRMKRQRSSPKQREEAVREVERLRGVCWDSIKKLESVVAATTKNYGELSTDGAVAGALVALKKSTKLNVKLGP